MFLLCEKLVLFRKNLLFSDSSIGALDSSHIEKVISQETLSACLDVGDSQETIPYRAADGRVSRGGRKDDERERRYAKNNLEYVDPKTGAKVTVQFFTGGK